MKETVKKVIVGIMAMATMTTFFSGCTNSEDTDSNSDTSISSEYTTSSEEEPIIPGVPIEENEFSVQFAYWYDSVKTTVENNFEDTGKTLFDKIKIYKDKNENELIFSGRGPIYMLNGKLAPNDFYRNLRAEVTGERYYPGIENTEEIETNFQKVLADAGVTQAETYEERLSDGDTLDLMNDIEYAVYVNNMATNITYRASDLVLSIYPVLDELNLAWFRGNITNNTAVLKLFTGVGTTEITIDCDENGLNIWHYPDRTETGATNTLEFNFTTDSFRISPEKLQSLLGYDIEIYGNVMNIVTDNKDLITADSYLPDIPEGEFKAYVEKDYNLVDTSKPIAEQLEAISSTDPTSEPPAPNGSDTSGSTSDTSSSEPTSEPLNPPTPSGLGSTDETSQPSGSSSSTPTPTTPSTGETSKPTSQTTTSTWNPDAPGNTPGPYGGYYDASEALHAIADNVPVDSEGYPLKSYYTETGMYVMNKSENDKAIEEERRIAAGGVPDLSDTDWSQIPGWDW